MLRRTRFLALMALLLGAIPLAAQESGFVVVVHESNPATSMSTADVAKLFLKKTTQWASGLKVRPVDQAASRAVRQSFSEEVHGKDVRAIKAYWQKLLFSGRAAPPAELVSDREVLDYVRHSTGAIGYVAATTSLGSGVKRLTLAE